MPQPPAPRLTAPARTGRFLAITFPTLAIDRFLSPRDGRGGRALSARPADAAPLALVAPLANAMRLTAIDARAAEAGLSPGMTLADARAMVPALVVADADPDGDAALLVRLADAARRFTPLVALDGASGLLLDIAGCAHLFGGEEPLMQDAIARLGAGIRHAEAAIASTPQAARALARHRPGLILPPGEERRALMPLGITALDLPVAIVEGLARVGLKRIADIIDLPRAPLAARFGADLLRRLDRALGHENEPLVPRLPAAPYLVERRFAEPVLLEADILATARRLAIRLAGLLEDHGEGARRVELALFRVDGAVSTLSVGMTRPGRDPDLIASLIAERLSALADPLDPGFGYDVIRLAAIEAGPFESDQARLGGGAEPAALDRLIDRLGARLGPARVEKLVAHPAHVPERAQVLMPAAHAHVATQAVWHQPAGPGLPPERPPHLFDPPERIEMMALTARGLPHRFRWRQRLFALTGAEGPERIAHPWWYPEALSGHPDGASRDYYRVEDERGLRLWLFATGPADGDTRPDMAGTLHNPRVWHIHGMFV